MVVDAFLYSSGYEDDILKLRLNSLNSVVDKFIIMEARHTHSGTPKELEFNIDKFSEFKDKIVYFNHDVEINPNQHITEQKARNSLLVEIDKFAGPEDVLIHGDLDEIPDVEVVADLLFLGVSRPYTLKGKYYLFCMDLFGRDSLDSVVIKRKMLGNLTLQDLRSHRTNWYYKDVFHFVPDSTYHYSSCFSKEGIVKKMKSFCHASEMDPTTLNDEYIVECIKRRKSWDRKGKDNEMVKVEMKHPNCPKYLEQNINQYKQYLSSSYE